MTNFYRQLGNRIKELRESKNYSQEKLGDFLGIKRESISQIEKGDRKISAEELSKLARLFNITTDALLDIKKEIKVVLEKVSAIKDERSEIRISVPQKKMDKFREVLLYVLNKVGSKPNVGESVIYKLLYFIDFNYYEKYENQLIGATYIKNHYGPTPVEFLEIVKDFEGKELTKVSDQYFQYPQTKYLPLREPDLSKLNAEEVKLIDEVLAKLSDFNATQISEYSHQDVPWLTTEQGEIIDYEKVFYRTAPYSARDYAEEKNF